MHYCQCNSLYKAQKETMRVMSSKKKHGSIVVKSATNKAQLYTVRIKTVPTCTCKDFGQGTYIRYYFLVRGKKNIKHFLYCFGYIVSCRLDLQTHHKCFD